MKAIWTGSIGFGLVNIPVKMYSAVDSSALDLDMLDKKDHANIKYKRVNEKTGKEVAWGNIVKGYMLDDKYVVLDDKDFEKASPEKTQHIAIDQFVEVGEIDSIYFEVPYYLVPQKTGTRAYALLRDALEKTKRVGLGTFVMRNREHLCVIKPHDKMLLVNRIRFAEEIRGTKDLSLPATKPKTGEMKMAVSLIEQLTAPFNPKDYKDDYNNALLKIIKAKAKGKSSSFKPMKIVHSKSQDIMEQLKASLSEKSKKKAS